MLTAASSISQKRRAGIPRKVTGATVTLRVALTGCVEVLPSGVVARSKVYQSIDPPSYSWAISPLVSAAAPRAKLYSMRAGVHDEGAAGWLKSESNHVAHAVATGKTLTASAALSAGAVGRVPEGAATRSARN